MDKKTEHFAPTIQTTYGTVTPLGFEWVLSFALHGCEWAIKEVNTPKFRTNIANYYRQHNAEHENEELNKILTRIKEIKG